ncbi:MAG: efflux RND transporter periplasmic adaptor subunit [Gemmatimonadetes bacterium]|nr:efflux RND transporter periplasmic adaptor subunit [Gemmatimonadota bacterium]
MRTSLTFLIFVPFAALACGKPAAPPKTPVPVTVTPVVRGDAPYVVRANGLVEPVQTVAVQSQVGGVLKEVRFREGDEVQEGQVLFEIDPVPYRAAAQQARAVLARDKAQFDAATRDAERYEALAQRDFVTRSQADQAAANAAALKAVVDADKANVENAQFNLDNATIRAPVHGKTGSVLVRQGNLVRPNATTPLVVINQIHPILVRFAVPQRELALVQKHSRDKALKATAFPGQGSGSAVLGALSFVDNGVDTTTGTVMLKARFANDENLLWPGQYVAIELEVFRESNAVLVPTPAVQTGQEGLFVFIVDKSGAAQVQAVTAGRAVGDQTVIETGLKGGEQVVVDGQSRLSIGAKVEIKKK